MSDREKKSLIRSIYEARRDRMIHPESGCWDKAGRWYPSDREDAGDVRGRIRSPSRAWPYSYMLACRTRKHCAVLVEAALRGESVPSDVSRAVAAAREAVAA